jgi:hypothetical protein
MLGSEGKSSRQLSMYLGVLRLAFAMSSAEGKLRTKDLLAVK